MPKRYSDGEIIQLILQGESDLSKGMEALYYQFRPKVFPGLVKHLGNKEEAEEIFQQALLSLTESIIDQRFKGKSSLHTYLYSIAKNLSYKKYHRSGKISPMSTVEVPEEIAENTPESIFLTQEIAQLVQEAIQKLAPKQQKVLSLWIRKHSMQEIAEKLGYSSPTVVRVTKSRGLKDLAEIIKNDPALQRAIKEIYDQF